MFTKKFIIVLSILFLSIITFVLDYFIIHNGVQGPLSIVGLVLFAGSIGYALFGK